MFKIIRVQLLSLCAILFLALSSSSSTTQPTSNQSQPTTNEALQNHHKLRRTSAETLKSASVFVTPTDDPQVAFKTLQANSTTTNRADQHDDDDSSTVSQQRKQAGKILDLTRTTNELSERDEYHLLTPKRGSANPATLPIRLVVVQPLQTGFFGKSRAKKTDVTTARRAANQRAVQRGRPSRHFGDILRGFYTTQIGARSLLSSGISGIEQRAGGLLHLGSNLLAALIPLVSLLGFGSHSDQHQQGANATSAGSTPTRGGVASLLAPPQKLIQFAASSGGVQSRVEYVMDILERSIEHLPNFPRLHPQECVKRSICEAHNEPTKYGALGLTLRLLFPASNFSTSATSEQDNMEFKVINKYRHAAGYGLARRLDATSNGQNGSDWNTSGGSNWPSAACKEKYEDCLVSLLDVAQKLVDLFVA